jgi:hypothetical protein
LASQRGRPLARGVVAVSAHAIPAKHKAMFLASVSVPQRTTHNAQPTPVHIANMAWWEHRLANLHFKGYTSTQRESLRAVPERAPAAAHACGLGVFSSQHAHAARGVYWRVNKRPVPVPHGGGRVKRADPSQTQGPRPRPRPLGRLNELICPWWPCVRPRARCGDAGDAQANTLVTVGQTRGQRAGAWVLGCEA